MDEAQCSTCRYWDAKGHGPFWARGNSLGDKFRRCRRHPPDVQMESESNDYGYSVWPYTPPDDWCGEWSASEALRGERFAAAAEATAQLGGIEIP